MYIAASGSWEWTCRQADVHVLGHTDTQTDRLRDAQTYIRLICLSFTSSHLFVANSARGSMS